MKNSCKLGISILFIIVVSGCKSTNKANTSSAIVGTWQLVEAYQSIGGPATWSAVEDGYTYTFSANGDFTSNRFSECTKGKYSVKSNELTLNFGCDGFTKGIEKPEGVLIEKIMVESDYVFIKPTYIICTEGCNYKFKKISE